MYQIQTWYALFQLENTKCFHICSLELYSKSPYYLDATLYIVFRSERFSWLIDVDGSRSALVQEYEELEVEEEFETEYKDCKPLLKRYISA